MTLIINNTDISSYIMQKEGITETPIYVDGPNAGTAKNGLPIRDRVCSRYSFAVSLIPIKQSVFEDIIEACEANEISVTYTSARNSANITTTGQATLSGWNFALTSGNERVYHGCMLTIEVDS